MRSWIFGAITLTCLTIGGAAIACPTGGEQGIRPPPRPVQPVQNVSLQASEMMERASRLESAAASREQQARALDQQADTLANRARNLRNQAQFVNASDRSSILDIADELQIRASNDRNQAMDDRNQASQFRVEASSLRSRAIQLVRLGGGGGWRGKGVPRATTTDLPSERGVTL
jgi:hypothetical protein